MRRGRVVLYLQSAFALVCGIGGAYEYVAFIVLGLPQSARAIEIVLSPAVFIALIGNVGCPFVVLGVAIVDHVSWGRAMFGVGLSVTLTIASFLALTPAVS